MYIYMHIYIYTFCNISAVVRKVSIGLQKSNFLQRMGWKTKFQTLSSMSFSLLSVTGFWVLYIVLNVMKKRNVLYLCTDSKAVLAPVHS